MKMMTVGLFILACNAQPGSYLDDTSPFSVCSNMRIVGARMDVRGVNRIAETPEERFKYPVAKLVKDDSSSPPPGTGWITIQAQFTSKKDQVRILIDHRALAIPIGNHDQLTYQVVPGEHQVMIGTDFFASEEIPVQVDASQKKTLVCGDDDVHSKRKPLYVHRYLFKRKRFYYIREVK
jgi:hypothetical protein